MIAYKLAKYVTAHAVYLAWSRLCLLLTTDKFSLRAPIEGLISAYVHDRILISCAWHEGACSFPSSLAANLFDQAATLSRYIYLSSLSEGPYIHLNVQRKMQGSENRTSGVSVDVADGRANSHQLLKQVSLHRIRAGVSKARFHCAAPGVRGCGELRARCYRASAEALVHPSPAS
jgi:hypothetical protein